MVGLCGPHVLITNPLANTVSVLNVARGVTLASFPVGTRPTTVFADAPTSSALVGRQGTATLVRVDLDAGLVTSLVVPGEVDGIDTTTDRLFLSSRADGGARIVSMLDRAGGVLANTVTAGSFAGPLIVYDGLRGSIYTATTGGSPETLAAWQQDAGTLVRVRQSTSLGGNGTQLALSPDRQHLAFAVGWGNAGYVVTDLNPATFTGTTSWNMGAYPSGAAFSPDSTLFASANYSNVLLYSVATHAETARPVYPATTCQNPTFVQSAFSRGGKYLFTLANCLSPTATSAIYWTPLF
jgi:hypothetical protein